MGSMKGPEMAKTVLIVDDSKTMQALLKTTLNRIPMLQIKEACNGREALEVLGREPVDLLVTDINMPEMDGLKLVEEVRSRKTLSDLPILVITTSAADAARGAGLQAANARVLQPVSGQEIVAVATQLLDAKAPDASGPRRSG
jgi:two-component system, chemotaxis family, chemotaxis protein CheY